MWSFVADMSRRPIGCVTLVSSTHNTWILETLRSRAIFFPFKRRWEQITLLSTAKMACCDTRGAERRKLSTVSIPLCHGCRVVKVLSRFHYSNGTNKQCHLSVNGFENGTLRITDSLLERYMESCPSGSTLDWSAYEKSIGHKLWWTVALEENVTLSNSQVLSVTYVRPVLSDVVGTVTFSFFLTTCW